MGCGSMAYICKDWMAIPLFLWATISLFDLAHKPTAPRALLAGTLLALGLLTKAYMLAVAAAALVILIVMILGRKLSSNAVLLFSVPVAALPGPWYIRHLSLYGSVSAMQEAAI